MIKVDNKKALSKLASKSFKASRTRNIFAVIAIALTSILFTTLFTLGIGAVENFQRQTMRMAGGDGHASLKYLNDKQYDAVKNNKLINTISYNKILADSVNNPELLKRRGELWYYDDNALKLCFCEPTAGKRPTAENEIMMDTLTMQLMDIPHEIGSKVTLELSVRGEEITRDFVLSGWWEGDNAFKSSLLLTSESYMTAHADELYYSYYDDTSMVGTINPLILFKNTFDLQGKLDTLIQESGFSSVEGSPDYVASNLNWSYISSGMTVDPSIVLGVIAAIVLIIFTGYLIIYNIFQISVIRDIRFYGLLKTIGTTSKQIRKILSKQVLILTVIGIPIGLIFGFILGKMLVPMLMGITTFSKFNDLDVKANPIIFIASALFAVITVIISIRKPAKIASSVSPVEAVRYTDTQNKQKNRKKSTDGGKIHKMSLSNLGRSKKRTVLVILSLSLSIVLLNTVFTVVSGFSIEKFVSRSVASDYRIFHADLLNFEYRGHDNEVTPDIMADIKNIEGFEEGGKIYFSLSDYITSLTDKESKEKGSYVPVYGIDSFVAENTFQLLEGVFDPEKFKSGDYIIEAVAVDDNGIPYNNGFLTVGEKVELNIQKNSDDPGFSKEYTVMAKIKERTSILDCGVSFGTRQNLYISTDQYEKVFDDPAVMSYLFNVESDKETDTDSFLQNYTDNVQPVYSFSSKASTIKEFEDMTSMITMVGGALSIVIGIIGIINFINSTMTGIITRKREFAMLQSIGMTDRQLKLMLVAEGIYYAAFTSITSFILGVLSSAVIVKGIIGQLWFFDYKFIIMPIIIMIPILIIMGILIPLISLKFSNNQSIVERLREVE